MFPQGPLLGGSETYQSLEIGRLHKGGTPSVSWNDGYNSGNTLDIPDSTTNPDIFIDYVKQPFSFIEIKEDFICLVPTNKPEDYSFSSETMLALWLSTLVNIQYYFSVKREPTLSNNLQKFHSLTIQLFYRIF